MTLGFPVSWVLETKDIIVPQHKTRTNWQPLASFYTIYVKTQLHVLVGPGKGTFENAVASAIHQDTNRFKWIVFIQDFGKES